MSDKSKIEWTEATWNPVTGCSKVSQGCKNCYAEREWARLSAPRTRCHDLKPITNIYTGRKFTDVKTHPDRLDQPLLWKKPRMIFVNSMSDLFHESVSDGFIADVFNVMAEAKHHTFQVLTKRAERMRDFFCGTSGMGCGGLFMPNVWLGVSVEDQATANERIPLLLDIECHVRWISAEPLLGPIDLTHITTSHGDIWNVLDKEEAELAAMEHGCDGIIHWVVAGGESGAHARAMHPDWVRSMRDQCAANQVPFFFKQWGEWTPDEPIELSHMRMTDKSLFVNPDGSTSYAIGDAGCSVVNRVGKKAAGSLLDGIDHKAYPEVLT